MNKFTLRDTFNAQIVRIDDSDTMEALKFIENLAVEAGDLHNAVYVIKCAITNEIELRIKHYSQFSVSQGEEVEMLRRVKELTRRVAVLRGLDEPSN